ncbi:hypothetical protein LKL35_37310 [Streptomyces sp. ET3-23]|uniref:hypothetical protein n=1 Tax=Streptomyces sp. ET3-23 TaxID=2885643 RepID=UPI001D1262E9|nr:hypothetical protein [Streptomyces sp. ET3-23]MCC2280972.1 hypothetical protein [Streptomyces sp. ET3-23]
MAFQNLYITFGIPEGKLTATVNNIPLTIATFTVPAADIHPVGTTQLSASNAPFTITDAASSVLQNTFGGSPWPTGSVVMTGSGAGTLKPSVLGIT